MEGRKMESRSAVTMISSPFLEDVAEIYLIRSEKNVLIDTGTGESPRKDIAPALESLGLSLADIHLILNTHGHPDHTGGNADIKEESGAQILIHSQDAVFIEDHESSFWKFIAPVTRVVRGEEFIEDEKRFFLNMAGPDLSVDQRVQDDDVVRIGNDVELQVIHIPGHTPGSVGFYWEKEGMLFTGDSLPGLHTENGGLPIIYDFSTYERSLERLQDLPVKVMLQAHPFRGFSLPPSPVKRGHEIKEYLQDCSLIAGMIRDAVSDLAQYANGVPFIEFADMVISRLPEKAKFKPMSKIPMPKYNALTILSAARLLNLDTLWPKH